jgi:hypothetical protein
VAPEFWDNYENACEAMAYWGNLGKLFALFIAIKWTVAGISLDSVLLATRRLLARVCSCVKSACMLLMYFVTCKNWKNCSQTSTFFQRSSPQNSDVFPREVRGQAWLNFGVTAYSAVFSLMVQCTTCVTLPGYQERGEVRWFYDGRVVCFSDVGERSGLWQIAASVAVVVLAVMPCCLVIYMSRASIKPEASFNTFDISAFPTYFDEFNSSNRHWFSVM